MKGIKFSIGFYGLTQKKRGYQKAINYLKNDSANRVQTYGSIMSDMLKEDSPKDIGILKASITGPDKYKLSERHVKIRLDPFVPYWVFQEFGLKKPRWVVVDTKPDLKDWVARHGVKTKTSYWDAMGQNVEMLLIGGPNTRLGRENKFVERARKFMKDNHVASLSLMAQGFRKALPIKDNAYMEISR